MLVCQEPLGLGGIKVSKEHLLVLMGTQSSS